jgi:hypothetical protein
MPPVCRAVLLAGASLVMDYIGGSMLVFASVYQHAVRTGLVRMV